jgi:Fur family transcriptional regulator, ferric uptake regulator
VATTGEQLSEVLHEHGMRMTPQRRLVLQAVERLGHATPDTVWSEVRTADPGMNASTVYRTLEVLERLGVIRHTHLGSGPSTYHAGGGAAHLHLVCESCGTVVDADVGLAADLVGRLRQAHGFSSDVAHMAISGQCVNCAPRRR